jgi:bifunctional UDP-N-acetylglucosamine pyrophosphorylase / glucosamine-1-phosphate N-acetyltransferase
MISYVLEALAACQIAKITVITGHQSESVRNALQGLGLDFVLQEPQLGTGHAVLAARGLLEEYPGEILILCGDIPLIRAETLLEFMRFHEERSSAVTIMTALVDEPTGYGRILRNNAGSVTRIVEEKDATGDEKTVREINTGVYLVNAKILYALLARIGTHNAQAEYYLTDIVEEALKDKILVHGFPLRDSREGTGINTRAELARVAAIVWESRRLALMESGVTLLDPSTVYVGPDVRIGADTVIHPVVSITGATEIGHDCTIESSVYLLDSRLGNRVKILQGSRLEKASVSDDTSIGPMAHLRPEAQIGKNARIGNFVEVKKSLVGDGTKASHLSYLGDSLIGRDVNIGCGTITCNYDGRHKHRTTIGDRCFVGSDVQFVAPVEIGEGSVIGAGSTITRNVPPRSLAVTRASQKVYPLRRMARDSSHTPVTVHDGQDQEDRSTGAKPETRVNSPESADQNSPNGKADLKSEGL